MKDRVGEHPGAVMHVGDVVKEGEVFPAVVVKPYSQKEWVDMFRPGNKIRTPDPAAHRYFSGHADIRVLLPGNDDLWVPRAQWDENPTRAEGDGKDLGFVTVVPLCGLFTTVSPPPLI